MSSNVPQVPVEQKGQVSDEISLRDLYLILKRRSRLIVGVTLGLALLTLAFSLLWPKSLKPTPARW